MKRETSTYPLRLPYELNEKLKYMSDFNCRSRNREIEVAVKRYVSDFERLYGTINIAPKD